MSTATSQANPNGAHPAAATEILVEYDPTTDGVKVSIDQVPKGTTVNFRDPNGCKLRIVFLSPEGGETDTVLDTDVCTMIIGGIYHFLCYFTPPGGTEGPAKTGGVLEIYPPRP